MALSNDLQDMVADISAAIAGAQTFGRAELEIWRRKLNAAARSANAIEADAVVATTVITDLCAGIDRGVADLAGLARIAREQVAS